MEYHYFTIEDIEMLLDFLIELVSEVDCFTKITRSIWMELKIRK